MLLAIAYLDLHESIGSGKLRDRFAWKLSQGAITGLHTPSQQQWQLKVYQDPCWIDDMDKEVFFVVFECTVKDIRYNSSWWVSTALKMGDGGGATPKKIWAIFCVS